MVLALGAALAAHRQLALAALQQLASDLIAAQARKRAGGGVVHPRSHCKWRGLDQHLPRLYIACSNNTPSMLLLGINHLEGLAFCLVNLPVLLLALLATVVCRVAASARSGGACPAHAALSHLSFPFNQLFLIY